MKESVGRIVHYVARGSADGHFPSVCRAAIITQVAGQVGEENQGVVGLAVLNPSGLFFDTVVHHDFANHPGTWHWPERVD